MSFKYSKRDLWVVLVMVVEIVSCTSESAQPVQQRASESPTHVPSLTSFQLETISKWNERLVQSSAKKEVLQFKRRFRTQRDTERGFKEKRVPQNSSYYERATAFPIPNEAFYLPDLSWKKSTTSPIEIHDESTFPYRKITSSTPEVFTDLTSRHPCHRWRHSHSLSTECPSTTTDTQVTGEIEKGVPNVMIAIEKSTTVAGSEKGIRIKDKSFNTTTSSGGLSVGDYKLRRKKVHFSGTLSSSSQVIKKTAFGQDGYSFSPMVQFSSTFSLEHRSSDYKNGRSTMSPSIEKYQEFQESSRPSDMSTTDEFSSGSSYTPFNKLFLSTSSTPGSLKDRDDHLMNFSVENTSITFDDDKLNDTTNKNTPSVSSSWSTPFENTRYNTFDTFETMSTTRTTPVSTSKEERSQERSQILLRFKQTHPIKLWQVVGYYDDDFLKSIDSHWLQLEPASVALHRFLGILYGVLMVVGCGGNLLVILMFIRCRSLRTPPNYLIVNLAVSDFLMMVKMPVFIYNSIYAGPALGSIGCEIYGFLGGLSGTASIMTLAAIAVDRYTVIVYPLNPMKRTTSARALLMTVSVWIYSTIFASLPLLGLNGYVPEGLLTSCSFDYLSPDTPDRIFVFIFFLAAFVVPLFLIVYSYARIFQTVRSAERLEMFNPQTSANGIPLTRESFKYRQEGKKQKTEVKIAVLSCTIILVWLLAWTPYATVALLGIFGYKRLITPFVSIVPALFCKSAACVNPFIYAINHPRFQRELRAKLPTFLTRPQSKRASSPDASYYSNPSATYQDQTNTVMPQKKNSAHSSSPADDAKSRCDGSSSSSPVSITLNLHGSPRTTMISRILSKSETPKANRSPLKSLLKDSKQNKTYIHAPIACMQTEKTMSTDNHKLCTFPVPEKTRLIRNDVIDLSSTESNKAEVEKCCDDTTRRSSSSAVIGERKYGLLGKSEAKALLEEDSITVGTVHYVNSLQVKTGDMHSRCETKRNKIVTTNETSTSERNFVKIIASDSTRAFSREETQAASRIVYETTII